MRIIRHHRKLSNDHRVLLTAPHLLAPQFRNRGEDGVALAVDANLLEGLAREAIETEDESLQGRPQYLVDVVEALQENAIGVEHEVTATDMGRVIQAVPQLVAQDQGLAIERRPHLTIRLLT